MRRLIQYILILAVLIPGSVEGEISEGGTGMLFGHNYAFKFTAPPGWVLDNESGVQQGLHMVFYPLGQSWRDSPVMAYGKSASKDSELRSIEDQVRMTVFDFHQGGSPDFSAKAAGQLALANGKKVHIYYFRGDRWGNFEAAGYVEEPESINFLVFHSRTQKEFEKNLAAFRSILLSYSNVFDNSMAVDEEKFNALVSEAKALEKMKEGKKYNSKVIKAFGNALADLMKSCTSYTTKEEWEPFDLFFRIRPDGTVSEVFVRPTNSLTSCVRGLVRDTKHPPHDFGQFLIHFKMKIRE